MKEDKGITRRQFIQVTSSLAVAGLLPETVLAQAKAEGPPAKISGNIPTDKTRPAKFFNKKPAFKYL